MLGGSDPWTPHFCWELHGYNFFWTKIFFVTFLYMLKIVWNAYKFYWPHLRGGRGLHILNWDRAKILLNEKKIRKIVFAYVSERSASFWTKNSFCLTSVCLHVQFLEKVNSKYCMVLEFWSVPSHITSLIHKFQKAPHYKQEEMVPTAAPTSILNLLVRMKKMFRVW